MESVRVVTCASFPPEGPTFPVMPSLTPNAWPNIFFGYIERDAVSPKFGETASNFFHLHIAYTLHCCCKLLNQDSKLLNILDSKEIQDSRLYIVNFQDSKRYFKTGLDMVVCTVKEAMVAASLFTTRYVCSSPGHLLILKRQHRPTGTTRTAGKWKRCTLSIPCPTKVSLGPGKKYILTMINQQVYQ